MNCQRDLKAYRSDITKVAEIELKLEKPEIYQLEELLKADKGIDMC